MIHSATFFTDRNTILANGKVIFIFDFNTPFFVEINKRSNTFSFTVFINRHGIMCGIKKQLGYFKFGQKAPHSKKSVQKAAGIVS